MTNKIVCVTAGHSNTGKIDSGAVTTVGGKLIKEADLAVKLRNAILHYLQQDKEITTRCDGYGTVNLELKEAIKLIKGSDAAVEVHFNSSTNKTANGVECIALPKDKVLAQKLSAAVSTADRAKSWMVLMKEQNSQVLLNYTSKISLMISVTTILCHVYRQMLFTKMHTFSELLWLVRQSPRDLLK